MINLQKKFLSIKMILNSMISTLLLLSLLIGFIVVEKNTRRIGFADNNPWVIYKNSCQSGHYVKFKFMDCFYTIDFSCLYDVTDIISQTTSKYVSELKNIVERR